jgi:hypothetical protein
MRAAANAPRTSEHRFLMVITSLSGTCRASLPSKKLRRKPMLVVATTL